MRSSWCRRQGGCTLAIFVASFDVYYRRIGVRICRDAIFVGWVGGTPNFYQWVMPAHHHVLAMHIIKLFKPFTASMVHIINIDCL